MFKKYGLIFKVNIRTLYTRSIKNPPKEFEFMPSTTQNIYVSSSMTPDIDYSNYRKHAQKLFSLTTKFIEPSHFNFRLPEDGVPEFAVVGRSNVGKSSFIKNLVRDNILVRVSKQPGCTRSINYYAFCEGVHKPMLYLVDLPGYGFARSSKTEKTRWQNMISDFLKSRNFSVLRRVFMLIDGRHGVKDSDKEMMKLLGDASLPYQIILTKSDLCSQQVIYDSLQTVFNEIMQKKCRHCLPVVHVISSHTDDGIVVLKQSMAEVVNQVWEVPKPNGGFGAGGGISIGSGVSADTASQFPQMPDASAFVPMDDQATSHPQLPDMQDADTPTPRSNKERKASRKKKQFPKENKNRSGGTANYDFGPNAGPASVTDPMTGKQGRVAAALKELQQVEEAEAAGDARMRQLHALKARRNLTSR